MIGKQEASRRETIKARANAFKLIGISEFSSKAHDIGDE
jgi:hypothetical protein